MTFEDRNNRKKRFKDLSGYFLVGIVSLLSVVVVPLLGTDFGTTIVIPNTWGGLAIWLCTRFTVVVVNLLIFDAFIKQAKINVKDDERYKSAVLKLNTIKEEAGIIPRSPEKFNKQQWRKKGTTLGISSILSSFLLTECIVNFDLTNFLTYLFTIGGAVAFGYLTMMNNEDYWTTEFPIYVDILFEKVSDCCVDVVSSNEKSNVNYNVNFQCKNLMSDKMLDKMSLKCKKPEIDLSWIKNPEILEITKDDMEAHDANRL